PIGQAVASGADAVVAVPDGVSQAACMASAWRAHGGRGRLLFSNSAQDPALVQSMGAEAQGLEGSGLAPDPGDGFTSAYTARFGKAPPPFAANAYDSVLMIA